VADKIRIEKLSFAYREHQVLDRVSAVFPARAISAVVGPSGQGKSTLLLAINRLWEEIPGARASGSVRIRLGGEWLEVNRPGLDLPGLRRRVGMVFQAPNPLPMSIFKNIAFPLRIAGIKDRAEIAARVETALRQAFLWAEVADRLEADARTLSGGQQQRLCIARALVTEPEVLLLDEPTSSLDAAAGRVIEELLVRLKAERTLVLVSHYEEQVARLADRVFRLENGLLAPVGPAAAG
jgi:phosphate transport system ATP-binding protein